MVLDFCGVLRISWKDVDDGLHYDFGTCMVTHLLEQPQEAS